MSWFSPHPFRRLLCLTSTILTLSLFAALPHASHADSTTLISQSNGTHGNGVSVLPSISHDGRYVAFASDSTNLVDGAANGVPQVYVQFVPGHLTELVSKSTQGNPGNAESLYPSISSSGQFVAYASSSDNLVGDDTNHCTDVFVYDRAARSTERVSLTADNQQCNGNSYHAAISADGRYVAFLSAATNIVPDASGGIVNVYVRDRWAGTTERVSTGVSGGQADNSCDFFPPSISGDGRFVAFPSLADNLVDHDTNRAWDVFVRDRQAGVTRRVSVSSSGNEANGDSYWPSISEDGHYVAFYSWASNLIASDTNGKVDVFVADLLGTNVDCVSIGPTGYQGDGDSNDPSISADGRYVAFKSKADNLSLTHSYQSGTWDVYVHDRLLQTTVRIDLSSQGVEANSTCDYLGPKIAGEGSKVAYNSFASNLVANDVNGNWDVFVGVVPAIHLGLPHFVKDGGRKYLSLRVYLRGYGAATVSGAWIVDYGRSFFVPAKAINLSSGDWQETAELQLDNLLYGKHSFLFLLSNPERLITTEMTGWLTGFQPEANGWWFDNNEQDRKNPWLYHLHDKWTGVCLGMTSTARWYYVANQPLPTWWSLGRIRGTILTAFEQVNDSIRQTDFPRIRGKTISDADDLEASGIMGRLAHLDPCDIGLMEFPADPNRHAVLGLAGFAGRDIHDPYAGEEIDELRLFAVYDPNHSGITRHLYVSRTAGASVLHWIPDGLDTYTYNTLLQVTRPWAP